MKRRKILYIPKFYYEYNVLQFMFMIFNVICEKVEKSISLTKIHM